MGKRFGGVFDIRSDRMRVFRAGEDRKTDDEEIIEGIDNPANVERFGDAFAHARNEIELLQGASEGFDREAFLAGPPDAGLLRLGDQQLSACARCSTR
jgi:peptide chain release factor 3